MTTHTVIDAQSGYSEPLYAETGAEALANARAWLRGGDYPDRRGTVRAGVLDEDGETVGTVAVELG